MRRVLSTFLLLFFGLGPLSAVLPAAEDVRLPACCRRNGAHHCAMTVEMAAALARMMAQDTTPGFSAPTTCPSYPGSIPALTAPGAALIARALSMPLVQKCAHLSAGEHHDALENPVRAYAGRGPPFTPLS